MALRWKSYAPNTIFKAVEAQDLADNGVIQLDAAADLADSNLVNANVCFVAAEHKLYTRVAPGVGADKWSVFSPGLSGLGGWADVTATTGNPTKHEYTDADGQDWTAYEWTANGGVTLTEGLVDVLCASTTYTGHPIGGRINRGVVTASGGTHTVKVGSYSRPSWQEKVSEIDGVMTSGVPVRPLDTNELGGPGAWSSGTGLDAWSGISYDITGNPVLYCHYQGTTPGSFHQDGTVIIRVPRDHALA